MKQPCSQAASEIDFLASLLNLAAAIETGSPENGSPSQRPAAEVRSPVRRRTGMDEPERIS